MTLVLSVLLIGTAAFPALATKLPEAAQPGYVSEAAVEAFASRAQNATTESVAIYGTNTCGLFINWCFNAIPELVSARGGKETGTSCISLVQALLWKKLGTFYWLCNGTVTQPIDSSLWNQWVGDLGPASQFQRVSSFTPQRGDIVVFSNGSKPTVLSHAGIMTSQTKWKHSSGGTVYPNPEVPYEGFNVKASYKNKKYNWSEYIVGFFRFNTTYVPPDTTAPVISSASLSSATSRGYWINVEASDDTALSHFLVGSWNDATGVDNASWQTVSIATGNTACSGIYIDAAELGGALNTRYHTNVYAVDTSGNRSAACRAADVYLEENRPQVASARFSYITPEQFDLDITVTDDGGLSYIQFCVWNDVTGRENALWKTEYASGTNVGFIYRFKISEFGGALNTTYHARIAAVDQCNNWTASDYEVSAWVDDWIPDEWEEANSLPYWITADKCLIQYNNRYASGEDSGWTDRIDPNAVSYTVRYRRKAEAAIEMISLGSRLINASCLESVALRPMIEPDYAYPVNLMWEIEDESIARVDNGVVTPYRPGAVWVMCTDALNGNASDSVQIIFHAEQLLIIPAETRVIEADAFRGGAFEEEVLPAGLDRICSGAFADCANLRLVIAPDPDTVIEPGAFSGCDGVTVVTSPRGSFMDYLFQTFEIDKCVEAEDLL